MFFANDTYGKKIHIDYAEIGGSYFCPGCGAAMIQKRGNINVHHFAHKVGKECDPWYAGKLSTWHIKMQHQFDKSAQEVVVWNKTHTEYHIADIALQTNQGKFIIEFQHSTISQKDFISRSKFYIECGYTLIWVFDFCECSSYKRILISEEYEDNLIRLVWPGRDRIRFLDGIDFAGCDSCLYIFFHINTSKGKLRWHNWEGAYVRDLRL